MEENTRGQNTDGRNSNERHRATRTDEGRRNIGHDPQSSSGRRHSDSSMMRRNSGFSKVNLSSSDYDGQLSDE